MERAALVYKDKIYAFDGEKLSSVEKKELRRFHVGALFPTHFLITLSLKLPLSTPKDQLDLQVELKMYNEGGLDPNKDYVIDYLTYELPNSDELLIEAFALDQDRLEEYIRPTIEKTGFLDVLFPRFIAYESLYKEQSNTCDIYFYLAEDEAFAAIYDRGRFIGVRQLYSLTQIAKRSGIEVAKLDSFLSSKGLSIDRYTPDEMHIYDALSDIFYKSVEKIVYAINFKRSYFGIEKADCLIVDFKGQMIPGLGELFESFGYEGLQVKPLECCGKQKDASLLVLANYLYRYEELWQRLNFSVYERKKPLYTYPVAKIAAAFLLFLLLLVGAGWYLEAQSSRLDEEIALKEQQLQSAKHKAKRYLAALKKLKTERQLLQKRVEELEAKAEVYQETLDMIPFIQSAKLEREKMINDIVEGLYTYKLSTRTIDQNSSKYSNVKLVSSSNERERIAKFMDYLYQKGYKNVTTRSILGQAGVYESEVKVER